MQNSRQNEAIAGDAGSAVYHCSPLVREAGKTQIKTVRDLRRALRAMRGPNREWPIFMSDADGEPLAMDDDDLDGITERWPDDWPHPEMRSGVLHLAAHYGPGAPPGLAARAASAFCYSAFATGRLGDVWEHVFSLRLTKGRIEAHILLNRRGLSGALCRFGMYGGIDPEDLRLLQVETARRAGIDMASCQPRCDDGPLSFDAFRKTGLYFADFPLLDAPPAGAREMTLVVSIWRRRGLLTCLFETESGTRFSLSAWWNRGYVLPTGEDARSLRPGRRIVLPA